MKLLDADTVKTLTDEAVNEIKTMRVSTFHFVPFLACRHTFAVCWQKCKVGGVVRFYESFKYNNQFWIVMELCEAGSLRQVQRSAKKDEMQE